MKSRIEGYGSINPHASPHPKTASKDISLAKSPKKTIALSDLKDTGRNKRNSKEDFY
ncbi:hypothetical protein RGU70_17320 [Herbaspirillum sp. RTI4]|uniref:hypothetical protein n=1 Tax=Herbaspirillum sp. RTI4 TaxID=3048640 RepID=UPI002AB54EFA|nr:hypothetical protein [Herbaspirillum sp. RTI4]MDY7580074.1 hypothetical protein [Herbaspirillum sp. RTI4]MEA9983301.1 hypothetical protein [Herbaspirillum sp. RTI4]